MSLSVHCALWLQDGLTQDTLSGAMLLDVESMPPTPEYSLSCFQEDITAREKKDAKNLSQLLVCSVSMRRMCRLSITGWSKHTQYLNHGWMIY